MDGMKSGQGRKDSDHASVRCAYKLEIHEGSELSERELDEFVRLFALWIVRDLGYKSPCLNLASTCLQYDLHLEGHNRNGGQQWA
jgi:hypothetical protein